MSTLDRIGLPAALGLAGTVGGLAVNTLNQLSQGAGIAAVSINGQPVEGGYEQQQQQVRAIATFAKYGVVRTNLFSVNMYPPRIIQSADFAPEELKLFAENINLPGVQLGTTSTRRYGIGPQQKIVNDYSFNDISIQFIVDGGGRIMSFLKTWMNKIVRFEDFFVVPEGRGSQSMLEPYMFEYKDNYQSQIDINVYNETRDQVMTYSLYEAFPLGISDISLGWGNTDELMRVTVPFAFTHWKQNVNASLGAQLRDIQRSGPALDVAGMLFQGSTAALMFAALKQPTHVGDVINVINNAGLLLDQFKI